MRQFSRLIVSVVAMFAAALVLNACADGTATVIRQAGPAGSECSPVGSTAAAYNCGGLSCSAGFTPGRVCESTATGGRWAATCSCVPMANPTPTGTVVAGSPCTEAQRHFARPARGGSITCAAGQLLIAECLPQGPNGTFIWAVGQTSCKSPNSDGVWCEPGSGSDHASCGRCGNASGQRRCDADGLGYGACIPCNNTQGCNPGQRRNTCLASCGGDRTAAGSEICNAAGTGYDCVANPGAQCSGSGGVCTPGATDTTCLHTCPGGSTVAGFRVCGTNGQWSACSPSSACPTTGVCTSGNTQSCTFSCSNGGTAPGTITCTSNGQWGTCTQNSSTTCSGGGGGGNGTLRVEIDPAFWEFERDANGNSTGARFCDQSNLNVRCFDWRGQQVRDPRTTNREISFDANWAGYVRCDVTCGTAENAPVHSYLAQISGQVASSGRGFRVIAVNGRGGGAMTDQIGTARICAGPGGPKLQVAVNPDQLGRCG